MSLGKLHSINQNQKKKTHPTAPDSCEYQKTCNLLKVYNVQALIKNMKLTKELSYVLVAIGLIAVATSLYLFTTNYQTAFGSVAVSNAYTATSTAANSVFGAFTSSRVVRTGTGVLGSIVITGAGTGTINFYDATTTSIAKRASGMATSTILLGSIPASLAAGTYVFDVAFKNGLYVDFSTLDAGTGSVPTTTITYRIE